MAAITPDDEPNQDAGAPDEATPAEPAAAHRNIRGQATFVPHVRLPWTDPAAAVLPAQNMVWRGADPEHAWIAEATAKIGDWRSLTRSVYLRWALTINASEKAEERFRGPAADQALFVNSLRIEGGAPRQAEIARWPAPEAADIYATITPLIAAYGVADLYGALEDVIFELYEIVLRHNPESLLRGDEYRELRRLRARRGDSAETEAACQAAWSERFGKWRRKRGYDGLHDVLVSLYQHAGLRRPSHYRQSDVADWASTLEMIGELRHHVIHGMATVSEKLGRLSNRPNSLTFQFVEGAALEVRMHHLQSVECFCEQLLNAFNQSMMEKVLGPFVDMVRPPAPGQGR